MVIKIDIFQKIKNEVNFRDGITRLYPGLQIKKHGGSSHQQRWTTICVFHSNDTTPSLIFYENGYYCFGCGAKGDLISFVARYENLTPIDAALKIADEFGITVNTARRPPTQAERRKMQAAAQERALQEAFSAWKRQMFIELCEWRDAVQAIFDKKKLEVGVDETELVHWLPYVEHLIEIMAIGAEGEKLEMFKNYLSLSAQGLQQDGCRAGGGV